MRCIFNEPPYTEPYVRWCERTAASHCLLLDSTTKIMVELLEIGYVEILNIRKKQIKILPNMEGLGDDYENL